MVRIDTLSMELCRKKLTQLPFFSATGTPISSNVFGPLPGGLDEGLAEAGVGGCVGAFALVGSFVSTFAGALAPGFLFG